MTVEYEPAMSREEFDTLFGAIIAAVEPWKLNAVADHMLDVARNYSQPGRKPRNRKARKQRKHKPDRRAEYKAYMKSDQWKEIRLVVLSRDHYTCLCCGDPATEVHHRSYSRRVLDGLDNSKLASICARCHTRIHFTDDNERRSRNETEQQYKLAIAARLRRAKLAATRIN